MRFIVDAQLPPALARWLVESGHEATHVSDHGLDSASDARIWTLAKATGSVLITKDEDFFVMHSRDPQGAKVIWIRRGNVTRAALLAWFGPLLPELCESLDRGETLIEIV